MEPRGNVDLTTLTGENGEYKELVENLFKTTVGNVLLSEILLTTEDEFLEAFGENNARIKYKLRGWINSYGLSGRFGKAKRKAAEMSKIADLIREEKDYETSAKRLLDFAQHYQDEGKEEEMRNACSPFKIEKWWKGREGGAEQELRDMKRKIEHNMQDNTLDNRAGRLVGIRLGSGCGKSHLLLEAPEVFGSYGIYITYNQEQDLRLDRQSPNMAILLRIILRLSGFTNKCCPEFFATDEGKALLALPRSDIQEFLLHMLQKIGREIFIGVDEVMRLAQPPAGSVDTIRLVLSELGKLSFDFYKKVLHRTCAVFVTSLNEDPFFKNSGREILHWSPESPDESGVEHILKPFIGDRDMNSCKAIAISCAGFHFRSLVFAAQALKEHNTPSVSSILLQIYNRWKERVEPHIFEHIKQYVIDKCRGTPVAADVKTLIEPYLDRHGRVPPALICGAFGIVLEDEHGSRVDTNNPLYGVFNCEHAYTDPSKHLEDFGTNFDFFRQANGLPVVPTSVVEGKDIIQYPKGTEWPKAPSWYKSLKYPVNMTKSKEALFAMTGKPPKVILTSSGKTPSENKYYHPKIKTHPWIDRAFIAQQDGEKCFVLIQDKVNNDVKKAVNDLNAAAKLICEHHKEEVLCIVNVIGATARSTAHKTLKYPHVLIRGPELDAYYSTNFAPVPRFVRDRHELEGSV